jgi:hypothetical protein
MEKPPDFVMYIVMVRFPGNKNFDPVWLRRLSAGDIAEGFRNKRDASREARIYKRRYGKASAYVQMYGPFS